VNIAWLSSDMVAEGALGVTDRIEGARHLSARGHRVTIVCGARPGARPVPGVATRFIASRYRPFLTWTSLWAGLAAALDEMDPAPHAVLTDFALLPPAHRWVRQRRRAVGGALPALVLDVRSHPVEAGRARLAAQRARFALTIRAYARRVDAVTSISPGLRDHVARLGRIPPRAIPIWSSGCSWADHPLPAPSWPAELDPGLRGRFVVVYQGSLSAGRGLFEAVRAVDIARREVPDLTLLFLGAGPARSELATAAERLGLGPHVAFVDPVPHDRVPEFLAAGHVGLAPWPATWDMEVNSPLKLAEYLSFGLPVVLTDTVPHRIVPPDAPFAFWAPRCDPESLARAMADAAHRRDELAALGRRAREWASTRLGWAAQVDILEEALRRAVARPVHQAATP
jgi:glycosyltransferase involved in cell wall biosynthesis